MFTRSHRRAAVVCGLLMTASLGSLMACSKATTEKASEAVSAAASDVSSDISSVAADVDANKTKDFVEKAAIANMFEIKTSELAVKTSKNADVLTFAKLMIKDHTAAGKAYEKAVAASTSGLTSPTALDDDHQKRRVRISIRPMSICKRAHMTMLLACSMTIRKTARTML